MECRQNFISNGLGTLTLDGVALNKHNRTIVHSLFLGSLILQAHNQLVHIKSLSLLIVIFVKPAPTCTPCALSPHHSIFERDVHQFCPCFVISQIHIIKMQKFKTYFFRFPNCLYLKCISRCFLIAKYENGFIYVLSQMRGKMENVLFFVFLSVAYREGVQKLFSSPSLELLLYM